MGVPHGVTHVMYRRMIVLAALGALSVAVPCAPAVAIGLSETVFTIEARNDSSTGSYSVCFAEGQWDPNSETFTWTLPGQFEIYDDDSGDWIASLVFAYVRARATQACEIELNIGVISGGSDTTFVFGSPLVSFETVAAAYAQAKATATVTLTHMSGDYAYLVGLGPIGTGVFRSYYNGYLSEGTRFAHLVGSVYVDGGGTADASQADPAFGYRPIGRDVWDMSTEIAFTLTAGDLAFVFTTSGMPEPAYCIGDVNGDGVVDFDDLSVVVGAYGTVVGTPGYDPYADFDHDGYIGLLDLAALLAVYGESC